MTLFLPISQNKLRFSFSDHCNCNIHTLTHSHSECRSFSSISTSGPLPPSSLLHHHHNTTIQISLSLSLFSAIPNKTNISFIKIQTNKHTTLQNPHTSFSKNSLTSQITFSVSYEIKDT